MVINNDKELEEATARMDAELDNPSDTFDELCEAIVAYEEIHYLFLI